MHVQRPSRDKVLLPPSPQSPKMSEDSCEIDGMGVELCVRRLSRDNVPSAQSPKHDAVPEDTRHAGGRLALYPVGANDVSSAPSPQYLPQVEIASNVFTIAADNEEQVQTLQTTRNEETSADNAIEIAPPATSTLFARIPLHPGKVSAAMLTATPVGQKTLFHRHHQTHLLPLPGGDPGRRTEITPLYVLYAKRSPMI